METGNDNLMNRLTRPIRNNKKGFAILVLVAMVVSVISGVIPSINGLADDGGPYVTHDVGDGPGVVTMNNASGEQSPSWQKVPKMFNISTFAEGTEDEEVTPKDEVDDSGWLLEGAEFTVKNLDEEVNLVVPMITGSEGEFTLKGLPVGKYEVKETKAPTGYEMLENRSIIVEVTADNPHAHVNFQNKELEVSPSIHKEWSKGTEAVDYKINYNYYAVNDELVEKSDVIFDTDTINIGNVFYFTPDKEVNKVNITDSNINVKNHKQYEYDVIEDGHDVTFLGDQIKRNIVVKKDFDGQKANNVDVELIELEEDVEIKDSNKVVGRVTLSEKNNWTHTFQDMPRYTDEQLATSISERNGEAIEYGVRELDFEGPADGYASVVEGNEIDSFVIVNKELEDIDVTIDKVWVGTKGDSAEFEIKVNGEVWETVPMTSADKWTKTVPLKQVPHDAEVTVEEINADEAYDINVIEDDDNKFVVEGVERLGSLEILMNKGLNDPKVSVVNVDRKEMATFEMFNTTDVETTRLAGAKFLVESKEVEEDAEGNMASVYEKEVTTNEDGLAVIADIPFGDYTITEIESPEGYEFGDMKSIDFTVTENQTRNKYRADFYNERSEVDAQDLDISVTTEWEFDKDVSGFTIPEEVEMKLVSKLSNGEVHEESEVFTLNEANNWTMDFADMPNVNNTNDYDELDYSVVVTSEIDGDFELELTKTGSYFNNEGNEVDILATNVEALGKVDVIKVEGTNAPTTDFELGEYAKAIDGAKFELREKENNKVVRESATTKNGKLTMVNLPYGEYTLTEIEAPAGYLPHDTNSIDITIDQAQTRDGVNVKFENETINENAVNVDVRSEWKDSKGKALDLDLVEDMEIKVELYRNDIEQGKFVTLNAENDWKASFDNLRQYEVGTDTEFEYTVKEIIEGGSSLDTEYQTELKGNAQDGFVVINTQIDTEPIDIPVVKKWMNDSEELEEVVLELKDGNKVIKSLTLTAEDDWKGVFESIPAKGNSYTLVELDHEGYKSSVYGNADESGYEVRNTQEKEAEVPEDDEEEEEKISLREIYDKIDGCSTYEDVKELVGRDGIKGKLTSKTQSTVSDQLLDTSEELFYWEEGNDYLQIGIIDGLVDIKAVYTDHSLTAHVGMKCNEDEKPENENPDGEKPTDENPDGEKPTDENPNGGRPEGENPYDEDPVKMSLNEMYDKINGDMTYQDVVNLVGFEGELGASDKIIMDEDVQASEFYRWEFENGDILQVGFEDGIATSKFALIDGETLAETGLIPNDENPEGGRPEGENPEGGEQANDGFKQTATSAIGLGLFAMAGLAGAGAVVYKKRKED